MFKLEKKQGTTLVEIAIVTAIIGIMSVSVITYSNITHYTKVQQLIQEQGAIRNAVQNFLQQFNALPGDIQNANTQIKSNTYGSPRNGNGDSKITDNTSVNGSCTTSEVYELWRHLFFTDLLSQKFTGCQEASPSYSLPGVNIPKSDSIKKEKTGYFLILQTSSHTDDAANTDVPKYYHKLYLGSYQNPNTTLPNTPKEPAVSSKIAQSIDLKIDDGKPMTGSFISLNSKESGAIQRCNTTDANFNTSEYQKSKNIDECIIVYRLTELPSFGK